MKIIEEAAYNVHKSVIRLFKSKNRGKVLDIAAGHGNISNCLNVMGYDVIAADINPDKFLIENVKCHYVDANYKLPFETETFDYVVSVETIEHLINPYNFISEVHRILKNDGIFVLTTPNVTTIQSRLIYLFTGNLKYFQQKNIDGGHIFPIFNWRIQKFINNKFKICSKKYNAGELIPILPHLGIRLYPFSRKFKSNLLGDIIIFEMSKL